MSDSFFVLHFATDAGVSLVETAGRIPPLEQPRYATRGKTAGACRGYGTFQWTSAVKALSMLMLRHKLYFDQLPHLAAISGGSGSLAASLDFSISKRPVWITDMFGTDPHGHAIAARLFLRTNSNRKRSGPVIVSINERLLTPDSIAIRRDGELLATREEIGGVLNLLEEQVSVGERQFFSLAVNA